MFFTKPTLTFSGSMYREPEETADQPTFGQIFSAYDKAANQSELGASYWNLSEVYDGHNAKVKEITGVDLPNPRKRYPGSFADSDEMRRYQEAILQYRRDGGEASTSAFYERWGEQEYRRKLEELAAKHPERREELLPEETFQSQAYAAGRRQEEEAARLYEKSGGGFGPWTASVLGSIWSAHDDPVTWLTAPIGFSGAVGTGVKGVAMGFLKAGTANAAVEASLQPFIQSYRSDAGMSSGVGEAATAVGSAFLFAGGLDAGVRSISRGLRRSFGYTPVVNKDGMVVAYRKLDANNKPVPGAPELKPETVTAASFGDPKAIREVSEVTGLAREPVVRTTLDAMDATEATFNRPVRTIPDSDHSAAMVQGLRHAADPDMEPLPVLHATASVHQIRTLEGDINEARADLAKVVAAAQQPQPPEAVALLAQTVQNIQGRIAEMTAQHEAMARTVMADDLITAVRDGQIPREVADLVAGHVANKDIQVRLARDVQAMKPATIDDARRGISELLASPDYRPQTPEPMPAPGLDKRAIDDPYGPDAVQQVAALEKQLSDELGIAAPQKAKESQKAEPRVATTDDAMWDAPKYRDPESGEALQESDVEAIVDMWTYVRETVTKKPQTLTNFIIRAGRLKDEAGELTNVLGGKSRQLINDKSGMELDYAALRAFEEGFFSERPDVATFLNALDSDWRGDFVFRLTDYEAVENWRVAQQMEEDLGRLGVDGARTPDEIRAYFRSEPGQEGVGSGAPDTPAAPTDRASVTTYADAKAELIRRVESGDYNEDEFFKLKGLVEDEIAAVAGRLPQGTGLKVMMTPDGIEGGFKDGEIFVSLLALDPKAIIRHEEIHALKASGLFSDAEWRLLVQAADKAGIKDDPFLEGKRSIREVYPETYGDRFRKEDGTIDQAALDRLIDEEAVAYMVQRRAAGADYGPANGLVARVKEFLERLRNVLTGYGFRSVDDVLRAIEAGEVGSRGAVEWGPGAMFAMRQDAEIGQGMRRDLDALGYYSGALEAAKNLRQAKGTPEQMLAMIKKEGAKDAEIAATGLQEFLAGKASVTKDEIVKHIEANRVTLIEAERNTAQGMAAKRGVDYNAISSERRNLYDTAETVRWKNYSLDPRNPTYRETVLHLGSREQNAYVMFDKDGNTLGQFPNRDAAFEAYQKANLGPGSGIKPKMQEFPDFRSGHFSEPNIIGHMMTSMTKHEGKPVYTVDQIQSDWGQKLRDGGVRDEAKITELASRVDEANRHVKAMVPEGMNQRQFETAIDGIRQAGSYERLMEFSASSRGALFPGYQYAAEQASKLPSNVMDAVDAARLLEAELSTAKSAASGNPLVNTTDQWVNTTLRRAIRQAAEADAEFIAVPSGQTVLSYNPGDEFGMRSFYGGADARTGEMAEGIVPKNLRKLLAKIDRESPAPQRIETLDSPSGKTGLGKGFTLFPLTPKVKESVIRDGQTLFAFRDDKGRLKPGSAERAQNLKTDMDEIEQAFQASGGDQRVKLQAKRAALLNSKAEEAGLDDVLAFRDMFSRADPAKGFLYLHESFGEGAAKDLENLRDTIANRTFEIMNKVAWNLRKGAILGDLRRSVVPSVRTTMTNMIREAAGKDTGDATAKSMAKAWLDAAEYLRQRFNAAGGNIGKLGSWFLPQFHDAGALMKAGLQKWVAYMMQDGVLDLDAMVNPRTQKPYTQPELRELLTFIWKNITTDGQYGAKIANFRGTGAMYKRHADHRVLHFKDVDQWMKYQREFGGGDFYSAMIGHVQMMARDIAAMERFGANPDLVRERLKQHILKDAGQARANQSMYDELKEMTDALTAQYKTVPTRYEEIMTEIGKVHGELDAVRGKAAPQLHGRSKRTRAKIEKLQDKLFKLHEDLKKEMESPTPLTPQQMEMSSRISKLLDEMASLDQYPVMSRDPLQRANRLLARADDLWGSYKGSSNVPADSVTANFLQGTRNLISSSALVYAPFSAVTDQATQLGARLMVGMPVTRQFSSFVRGFTQMDRKEALAVGLGLDQVRAAFETQSRMLGKFNTHGWTGFVADRTHAYSFLSPMTQASKVAFGLDFMRFMAAQREKAFADLPPNTRAMLERNGFAPDEWETLRKAAPETRQGVDLYTRKAVADGAGDELAEKYMVMLYRARSKAVIEGTTRGRTAIVSDSQPGSVTGEALRSVAMLKSFPISYASLILTDLVRMVMEGRYQSAAAYGFSIFIVGSLLGAVAMQLKNIGQGRDPEDMTNPDFWAKAFMQSGGAGIYGDFIASGVNRNGSSFAATMAGPLFDRVGTLRDLTVGNVMQYATEEKTNAGRETVRALRQWTPGMIAPWYVRRAYERMILDEMQKMLDPDAHKTFRARVTAQKKRAGNDYFHPPGVPYAPRGPNWSAAFGQ